MYTKQQILDELSTIIDPRINRNIVEADMVSSIFIRGDKIGFALEIKNNPTNDDENLRLKCLDHIKNITKKLDLIILSKDIKEEKGGFA